MKEKKISCKQKTRGSSPFSININALIFYVITLCKRDDRKDKLNIKIMGKKVGEVEV